MKPIELVDVNASIIQGLLDNRVYAVPIMDVSMIQKIVKADTIHSIELQNFIQEINESISPVKISLFANVCVQVGDIQLDCMDGIIDICASPSSAKIFLCDKLIARAIQMYPDRKCMRLDCDGSVHISSRLLTDSAKIEYFRIRSWVQLISTLDFILNCIVEGHGEAPSLVIVDSLSALFNISETASVEPRKPSHLILSHIVATARRINESGNTVIVLVKQTTTQKSSSPGECWTVNPRLGSQYRDILAQHPHKTICL